MANLAPIVLTGTSGNVTLSPVGINPMTSVATLRDNKGELANAETLGLSLNPPKGSRITYRPRVRLSVPVTANVGTEANPSYQVVRTAVADVEFQFSKYSTLAERKEIVKQFVSALGGDIIKDLVENLNDVW